MEFCSNCHTTLRPDQQKLGLCDSCKDEEMLVARAAIPNLAALHKRGKAAGLIKPQQDYS